VDNVRNQRENVILTVANAQAQIGLPSTDPVSSFLPPYCKCWAANDQGKRKKRGNTKRGYIKQEKKDTQTSARWT
jgi:hypothetical protein